MDTEDVLLFTRKEAAKRLGISTLTLDRLRKRGVVRANTLTSHPRYSRQELERVAAIQEATTTGSGEKGAA